MNKPMNTVTVALCSLASLFALACGSDDSETSTTQAAATETETNDDPATTTVTETSAADSSETIEVPDADFDALADCLADHGIDVPPMTAPGRPELPADVDPEVAQAAFTECAEFLPGTGRPGADDGTGSDLTALTAYQNCLEDNGVEFSEEDRATHRLPTDDPQFASADEICGVLNPDGPDSTDAD